MLLVELIFEPAEAVQLKHEARINPRLQSQALMRRYVAQGETVHTSGFRGDVSNVAAGAMTTLVADRRGSCCAQAVR